MRLVSNISTEEDLHLAETQDLIQAIHEGREPTIPIEEGVLSLQLALTAVQPAENGLPIKLEL